MARLSAELDLDVLQFCNRSPAAFASFVDGPNQAEP